MNFNSTKAPKLHKSEVASHCTYDQTSYMNKLGLVALYVVLSFLDGGLTFLNTKGNLILESWNCFVLSLLQRLAGMVAVFMIWMQ